MPPHREHYRKGISPLVFAACLALAATATGAGKESKPPTYGGIEAAIPKERDVLWWARRHKEKVALAAKGEAELVMIGDSLVHNFEVKGRQLWALYFGRYRPLNLGFNADLTEHALWRLQNGELDGISPRLAIIMIGTNNGGLRRDPPAFTQAGIAAIIDEIRTRLPETRILLLGIFPRGPFPRHQLRILNASVNEVLPDLAEADPMVRYMDIPPNTSSEQDMPGKISTPSSSACSAIHRQTLPMDTI